jgi:predicted component of type VI protein secretion system
MEKKLRSLITQLVNEEISLMEKKRKKDEAPSEENVELNLDMPAEEPAAEPTTEPATEPTTEPDMDLSGGDSTEKRIGQGLQMALDAAKEMPDGENKTKLVRQIGNTALFFLKTQIPGTGDQV